MVRPVAPLRLFRNPWLERLTVISPVAFVGMWAAILPLVIWSALGSTSPWAAAGLVGLGCIGWSLFEYAMHRYLFHWRPRSPALSATIFVMHGNHHAMPNDRLRNLMPPVVSLPVAAMIWGGCVLAAGAAGTWLFLGFIGGYVIYDLVHYACHQWPMKGRLGRVLKQHHLRHHFLPTEGNYAITGIVWDWLFGSRIGSGRVQAHATGAAE